MSHSWCTFYDSKENVYTTLHVDDEWDMVMILQNFKFDDETRRWTKVYFRKERPGIYECLGYEICQEEEEEVDYLRNLANESPMSLMLDKPAKNQPVGGVYRINSIPDGDRFKFYFTKATHD